VRRSQSQLSNRVYGHRRPASYRSNSRKRKLDQERLAALARRRQRLWRERQWREWRREKQAQDAAQSGVEFFSVPQSYSQGYLSPPRTAPARGLALRLEDRGARIQVEGGSAGDHHPGGRQGKRPRGLLSRAWRNEGEGGNDSDEGNTRKVSWWKDRPVTAQTGPIESLLPLVIEDKRNEQRGKVLEYWTEQVECQCFLASGCWILFPVCCLLV
jgi:hypothetical protein